jgi:DNA-binding response OmpR family regulator
MPTILVVDDTPANIKLLDALLTAQGHTVVGASTGAEALELLDREPADIVLLDIVMPGIDGYEVCRRIRQSTATAQVPVVMLTASVDEDKLKALEAGADDFIAKPFDQAELVARVRSLLRVKEYHDVIEGQAAQLADWNATLETRVTEQVSELERLGRLRRFLSPQLVDLVVSSQDEGVLASHRREVAVVFCDLRGFTAFSEAAEPEEVMAALAEFHSAAGALINRFEATVGHFGGDGLMVFFNDPLPTTDPASSAVKLAVAMRDAMDQVVERWQRLGHELGFGAGIDYGYATLGEVGFEGRYEYAVIGSVANMASRLCDEASSGQILISPRVHTEVESLVVGELLAPVTLKGFRKPVAPFSVVSLREPAAPSRERLTPREVEVAALLATGLTNGQIAEKLVVSERTVDAHVEHIRNKLGLRTRAQISAWVTKQELAGQ